MQQIIFHRLKRDVDNEGLIPQYLALRNERYAADGIAYTEAEQFFDDHPNTEFVIATRDNVVIGGGRILKKLPGENFSLSFQVPPFESEFQKCLKDTGLNIDNLTVMEIGGVASVASIDPTEIIGARIQNELSKIAREVPCIAASKVKLSNGLSVARTSLLQPDNIKTVIAPHLDYHGNEVGLFLYTNEPELHPAFDSLLSTGSVLSPTDYIMQNRKRGAGEPPVAQNSLTSALIALAMRNTGHDKQYSHLVPPDALRFYDAVKETCMRKDSLVHEAGRTGRKLNRILDSMANKGIAEHYALRKLLIEQQSEKLIKEKGIEQIIVIGAGFDSMALRLHKRFPGVDFTEIDLPSTQELKKQSLARGLQAAQTSAHRDLFTPADNFHLVGCDLSKQSLDVALSEQCPSFDPAKKTLFIAEGVSMYLTAADNQKLIQSMQRACTDKSFVLMGIAEESALSNTAARTMHSYGEHYRWTLPHADVKDIMATHGLHLVGETTYAQLQHALASKHVPENPIGENYYLLESGHDAAIAAPPADITPAIPPLQKRSKA